MNVNMDYVISVRCLCNISGDR